MGELENWFLLTDKMNRIQCLSIYTCKCKENYLTDYKTDRLTELQLINTWAEYLPAHVTKYPVHTTRGIKLYNTCNKIKLWNKTKTCIQSTIVVRP
jgi:hypothetical protein